MKLAGIVAADSPDVWARLGPVQRPNVDRGTLPEQIARQIEHLITTGELTVGGRLPSERELARIFGVSRLAVREATQRLEARDLVSVRRSSGTFITASVSGVPSPPAKPPELPTSVDLEELFEIRRLVEPPAARWAALRADAVARDTLGRLMHRFEETARGSEQPFELLASLDVELHLQIARAAENGLLMTLVEQLASLQRVQLEWSLQRVGRLERTTAEHRRIVEAIVDGDPDGAYEAMLAHLVAATVPLAVIDQRGAVD